MRSNSPLSARLRRVHRQLESLGSWQCLQLLESRRLLSAWPVPPSLEVVYPDNAGVISVKSFGAVGDGVTDDTAALQAAITANVSTACVLYIPNGTYRVTNKLTFGSNSPMHLRLQGQSRSGVVIKLDNNAVSFQNASAPTPVIEMIDREPGLPVYGIGFDLYVRNMTIDTGSGNPGAIGIRFMGNNVAGLSDLTIRSTDPSYVGSAGITLDRRAPGPAMFSNLLIQGFDYGINSTTRNYCEVFENIIVRDQRVAGVHTSQETMTFRRFESNNQVPAFIIDSKTGSYSRYAQVVVIDGYFSGGAANNAAIVNGSYVVLRNATAVGYGKLVDNTGPGTPDLNVLTVPGDYISDSANSLWSSSLQTLNLPVEETPQPASSPPDQWVRVNATASRSVQNGKTYNIVSNGSAALQAAIDQAAAEGKSTVYFPNLSPAGEITKFYVSNPVVIRGSVRRIMGLNTKVEIGGSLIGGTGFAFTIDSSLAGQTVSIEDISFGPTAEGRTSNCTVINHTSNATLVLKNLEFPSAYAYSSTSSGKVFIENCVGMNWKFSPGQKVFARQYNTETTGNQTELNGADFWVLGIKTENTGTVIKATNSRVEILGGYLTPSRGGIPADRPAFELIDSQASIITQTDGNAGDSNYATMVKDTRGGQTKVMSMRSLPLWYNDGGGTLQLYTNRLPAAGDTDFNQGYVLREMWDAPNVPAPFGDPSVWNNSTPDARMHSTSMMTLFTTSAAALRFSTGFADRLRAQVVPAESGSYRFYVDRGDGRDTVVLRFSATGDPNATTQLTLQQDPVNSKRLVSSPVTLAIGQTPLVDVFIRRYGGWAVASVGWIRPTGSTEMIGGNRLAGYLAAVPAAPSGLSATAASSSQINLAWTDNSTNETGFKIERATDSGFTQNLTLVTTTAANATSYSNTGLTASTTYYYRVRATNSNGDSGSSNAVIATTRAEVVIVSTGGAATASSGSGAEGPDKAFDGSSSTKWMAAASTAWLQYQFATGQSHAVTRYTITSANDVPARDPKNWTLKASQDGVNWVSLDTRTNQSFSGRFATNTYDFANTAAFAHYRLDITANSGSSYTQLSELTLLAPRVPVNVATDGTATASSGSGSEGPDKAFDGSSSTKWMAPATTAWLQYQFGGGQSHAVTRYTITSANDMPARDPRNWSLTASQDGVNWFALDTQTDQVFSARFMTRTYTLANTTAYSYYRLNITANNGGSYTQLSELTLLA